MLFSLEKAKEKSRIQVDNQDISEITLAEVGKSTKRLVSEKVPGPGIPRHSQILNQELAGGFFLKKSRLLNLQGSRSNAD